MCYGEKESNLEKEIDRLDRWIDINYLYNIKLVQNETENYNEIFKQKQIYLETIEYLPQNLLNQYKIYQIAIKTLVDNQQRNLLEKINIHTMEKVLGQVMKAENVNDIVSYYISSLTNEVIKK